MQSWVDGDRVFEALDGGQGAVAGGGEEGAHTGMVCGMGRSL